MWIISSEFFLHHLSHWSPRFTKIYDYFCHTDNNKTTKCIAMKKEKESAILPKHITLHHLESCNDISRPYIILNNLKNHMTKEHAANTRQKRTYHPSWKSNL